MLYTPHVANLGLWKTSGHFDFYKEGMFDQMDVEGDEYQIKPMNCPFHCLVYKDDLRSYRSERDVIDEFSKRSIIHSLLSTSEACVKAWKGGIRELSVYMEHLL